MDTSIIQLTQIISVFSKMIQIRIELAYFMYVVKFMVKYKHVKFIYTYSFISLNLLQVILKLPTKNINDQLLYLDRI